MIYIQENKTLVPISTCVITALYTAPIPISAWPPFLLPVEIKRFSKPSGAQTIVPSIVKQIFMLFFNSSLLEVIVNHTNKCAAECMGNCYNTANNHS